MSEINPKKELIRLYAKQLRLPTIAKYEPIMRHATEDGMGYEDFLCELLANEVATRQENQLKRRIKAAGFPLAKSLDEFDFKALEHVEEALVWQLATGDFVANRENVIMIGNPGTGKTHLAIGLGMRICKAGYKVRFYTAAQLANELAEAQEYHHLSKVEKQLSKIDLLILDELSYLSFNKHHSELLFQVLSERSERTSVMITTNLEFSRWVEFFQDTVLTAALVDRLTFRAHILNMNGTSYRFKQHAAARRG
jgi:DNA replication protein DnaC